MTELDTFDSGSVHYNKSHASISIVISTFEREADLREALDSVLDQKLLPLEVIVVDDSYSTGVERATNEKNALFAKKAVPLVYKRNTRDRGLTIARNIGAKMARGDIVLFVDDDVVLDKNYLGALLRIYSENRDAKGAQGWWMPKPSSGAKFLLGNLFGGVFFVWQYTQGRTEVLPSLGWTYPHTLRSTTSCQWLSGCNQSYLRTIFNEMQFDENLKWYSLGEDLDFSYRVYKKYPGSLFVTPEAKLKHKSSNISIPSQRERTVMHLLYTRYLFSKLIDQTLRNRLMFSWSVLGRILALLFISSARVNANGKWTLADRLKAVREAESLCRKHKQEIQHGNLDFFNQTLA